MSRPPSRRPSSPATTGTTATMQAYSNGAIYSITSGLNRNTLFTVASPSMACSEQQRSRRQLWACRSRKRSSSPAATTARLSKAASSNTRPAAVVQPSASRLQRATRRRSRGQHPEPQLGQSVTLTHPHQCTGVALADRPVSWSTTNSRVVTSRHSNGAAVATAVGGGAASVTAASEGVASRS